VHLYYSQSSFEEKRERQCEEMTDYKALLIKMIEKLPDQALICLHRLAKYLYIYKEGEQKEGKVSDGE